jgi:hypothetical protein
MKSVPSIVIVPKGRFANLMFQYMLAWEINRRLAHCGNVYGPGIPEWGIQPSTPAQAPSHPYLLKGHLFDLDEATYALRSGIADAIVILGWGMRLEYHQNRRALLPLFQSQARTQSISQDEILIHIRAEDIEHGKHRGYYPLPFDFYDQVIKITGKRPVFMGQIHEGRYASALREAFGNARFLDSNSPISDFETIRSARHIVLSISSFSWLAAWLSTTAETIHYPVAGLFDPRPGKQNLMPYGDSRYIHWAVPFPSMPERQKIESAEDWARQTRGARSLTLQERNALAISSFTVRVPVNALAYSKK